MASNLSPPPLDDQPQLADLVRILDVAAEMRSDREMASRELAVDETKQMLRERLLASARLTGDSATPEEIEAAIEQYYQSLYTLREPHWNLTVALAHLYVRRVPLVLATTGLLLAGVIGWSLSSPTSAQVTSSEPPITASMQAVLDEEYEVRVVSDPKAKSGMDRYYTDTDGKRVSGYYLLVEAHAAGGRLLSRPVMNAETKQTETVRIWGESVPDEVWQRIKADKKADGILDETLFAVKKRGQLAAQIVMKGVSADSGNRRQITRW